MHTMKIRHLLSAAFITSAFILCGINWPLHVATVFCILGILFALFLLKLFRDLREEAKDYREEFDL